MNTVVSSIIKLPIILVGMMGSWKSTIGEKLSASLKFGFIDMDDEIEHKMSKSIVEIFKTSGEKYFRELESQFLRNCIVMHENIISTGGGVVLALKNRNVLMNNGYKIYLKASPKVLADRIRNIDKRPLLMQNIPLITQLTKYCDERDPLYKICCKYYIGYR